MLTEWRQNTRIELKLGLVSMKKLTRADYTMKICNQYIPPPLIGLLIKPMPQKHINVHSLTTRSWFWLSSLLQPCRSLWLKTLVMCTESMGRVHTGSWLVTDRYTSLWCHFISLSVIPSDWNYWLCLLQSLKNHRNLGHAFLIFKWLSGCEEDFNKQLTNPTFKYWPIAQTNSQTFCLIRMMLNEELITFCFS